MKKALNRLTNYYSKPYNVVLLAMILCLTYLVVFPLLSIFQDTVIVHNAEVMRITGSKAGDLTAYHWLKILLGKESMNNFYTPLMHSLITSLGSCFVAILVGGLYAWLVVRTDLRYKKTVAQLFMLPYIMPSWTLALAWSNFFKNSLVGGTTGIFTSITGIATANWFAYGPFPIMLVSGLHYAPFAYILIGGVLRNMDSNLEEAATVLKTSKWRMMLKITIPLALPSILSTFILVFSSGMNAFATAQFLGLPVKYYTLTTQMYRYLNGTNPGAGYALALMMIIISMLVLGINQKMIGTRKSYTTVSGKCSNISLTKLRGSRNTISIIAVAFIFCITIVPLTSFAIESLITIQGNYELSNFSLKYWIGTDNAITNGILVNSTVWRALKNTIIIAVCCALGAGTLGCLSGYAIVKRWGSKVSNIVNGLTFIPYLIPSLAFGTIYLSMFSQQRGFIPALYGSPILLFIIGTVKYLPMASRSGVNSMFQISATLEESAQILGAGWVKRMTRILIPIQKQSIVSGYLIPFMSGMRELELFVLLYTPGTIVLTALLFQYNSKGYDQYANAITLMIVLIVIVADKLISKLTGASIETGIGG
ncbi:iron(III) transport system permease protein [Lachnotalea glycerini]|uniref:Iron(III) transport system permease protein n=2 Tax=Lachnotalea glycerini TaxID=1763509 RepID=A0A318EKR3_9FIRM|nr:iron ABC transporter permease [Lachnotalea glycerini]PXV89220.1 iron(III) transport system permease protein [Lachnotalea glycerini]